MKKECENNECELYCSDEDYISDDEIRVTFKCSLCPAKFSGIIKRE